MSLRSGTGDRSREASVLFAVGLTFLLVGLFVAAFNRGGVAAQFMCATWITLAFGLLSQTIALERDVVGPEEVALGIVGFPALLVALAMGFAFAERFPWGVPRSRIGRWVGYVLYAWGAVATAGLVAHFVARSSGEAVRGPFGVSYPDFFAAVNSAFQLYVAAVGLGMIGLSIRNLRRATVPAQRRRAKWLIYGTIAGVAPFTFFQTLTAVAPRFAVASFVTRFDDIGSASLVLLPVLVAYGIATERLFDVEVVVRRGIKYLLARGLLRTVIVVQWTALTYILATHADMTIRDALVGNAWLILLLAVTALSLQYQRPLAAWIDRRFFREALDRELTLRELADELERVDSLDACAQLVRSRLDATVHPKTSRVLFDADAAGASAVERASDVELVIPMIAGDGTVAGALELGEKRSEQPYSATDLELLATIAARMASVWQRVRLREQTRTAEASERRARDENRAKSLFLAAMSHELRTPLNAVLGFAQLIRRDPLLGAENREYLETILRSGEHLLGLINDVLSIAKIEAGKMTLSIQPFDFNRFVRAVEEMIGVRARAKGLAFVVERAEGLPTVVLGDEGKLRQVLLNLLGNAMKFTESGSVRLRVAWEDGRAAFDVEDTGRGIAPDEMEKLFVPFEQTESGRSEADGTGLGLAISREMVRLMGGDIRVSSRVGVGTSFAFEMEMPVAVSHEPIGERRVAIAVEPSGRGRRVLVVDDTRENRLVLVKLLESVGLAVREAENGAEAVETWAAWRPDLVFMDMRMPVVGGLVATAEIRRRESEEGAEVRTRIVALTASAFEHERDEILAGGCDRFVTKPFREEAIFDALTELIGVKFVYEAAGISAARVEAVTLDRLAAMPPERLGALKEALTLGDVTEIRRVVAAIAADDRELAESLAAAISAYRYDALLELAERVAP